MSRYEQIWKSLQDDEYRREYTVDVDTGLAFQIRALRERNGWSQTKLGERAGGKRQKVISDWENPNYGRYSLQSLKSLATAFDVGLMVRFVPFSELVNWNANLTPERLAPPSFEEEARAGYQPSRALHMGEGVSIGPNDPLWHGLVTDLDALTAPHFQLHAYPADAVIHWVSGTAESKERNHAQAA